MFCQKSFATENYVGLRLNPLAEITGNLPIESQIRNTLKQLYKKSYRGLQYFLDPQSPLQYAYPVHTKEENNTIAKPCKCVFIGHDDLLCNTLEKLYSGYIMYKHITDVYLLSVHLHTLTLVLMYNRLVQNKCYTYSFCYFHFIINHYFNFLI